MVLLPDPFAPTMASSSDGRMTKLESFRAMKLGGNCLRRCNTLKAAGVVMSWDSFRGSMTSISSVGLSATGTDTVGFLRLKRGAFG